MTPEEQKAFDEMKAAQEKAAADLAALTQVKNDLEAQQNALLQDNDVAKIIQAKTAGETFKLVVGASDTPAPEIKKTVKDIVSDVSTEDGTLADMTLDQLSNVLTDVVESQVDAKVASGIKLATESIAPTIQGIQADMKNLINGIAQQKQMSDSEKLVQKYPDALNYKDDINAYLKQNPGGSLDDAYILAKTKKMQATGGGFNFTESGQETSVPEVTDISATLLGVKKDKLSRHELQAKTKESIRRALGR